MKSTVHTTTTCPKTNSMLTSREWYMISGTDRYAKKPNILDVIGGVFAVWSLESTTELCPTARRPLPAEVVAIVRLLGLDASKSRLHALANTIGVESWWTETKCPPDSGHLVEVSSDQNRTGKVCGARSRVNCSELHWLP